MAQQTDDISVAIALFILFVGNPFGWALVWAFWRFVNKWTR